MQCESTFNGYRTWTQSDISRSVRMMLFQSKMISSAICVTVGELSMKNVLVLHRIVRTSFDYSAALITFQMKKKLTLQLQVCSCWIDLILTMCGGQSPAVGKSFISLPGDGCKFSGRQSSLLPSGGSYNCCCWGGFSLPSHGSGFAPLSAGFFTLRLALFASDCVPSVLERLARLKQILQYTVLPNKENRHNLLQ